MSMFGQNSVPSPYQGLYPTAVPNSQQVVIPQITIPQITQPQPWQNIGWNGNGSTQGTQVGPQPYKVHGMDGAKAFPTQANGMYALFDDDDDVFYLKETDGNNYPSIRRFRFVEEDEPAPAPPPEYVTKDDYNLLFGNYKKLMEDVTAIKKDLYSVKERDDG